MKRFFILFVSLVFALSLTSCGGTPSAENSDVSIEETTSEGNAATTEINSTATTGETSQTTVETTAAETTIEAAETAAKTVAETKSKGIADIQNNSVRTLFLFDNGDVYLAGNDVVDRSITYKTPVKIFENASSVSEWFFTDCLGIVDNDNNYYIMGTIPDGTVYTSFTNYMSNVQKTGDGLILTLDENLYMWGHYKDYYNYECSIGTPQLLLSDVKEFYGTFLFGFALTNSGELYAWNYRGVKTYWIASDVREAGVSGDDSWFITNGNALYEVDRDTIKSPSPVFIAENVKTAYLNQLTPSYISTGNELYMWGFYNSLLVDKNPNGGNWIAAPQWITDNVVEAQSWYTSVYLDTSGNLMTFGSNQEGLLGIGTDDFIYSVDKNNILTNISKFYYGSQLFAASKDGKVYMWGYNDNECCFNGGIGENSPNQQGYIVMTPTEVIFP